MRKTILSLIAAGITVAHFSSSIAATPPANYVGIFGTNSSQTNFVIPAGDSVYIARWLPQSDNNGNSTGKAIATFLTITKTITNSIIYVGGKPKIATTTNSVTNASSINIFSTPDEPFAHVDIMRGILITGPGNISLTNTSFQYKYFPKKSPYQAIVAPAGTTNPISITIPSGQKLHQIKMFNNEYYYDSTMGIPWAMIGTSLNGLNLESDQTLNLTEDVYGPGTLSFFPNDPGDGTGSPADFYFSYILINSDATNLPITTP